MVLGQTIYVLDRVRGKRKCPFLSEGCPATMRIPESGHFLILIDSKKSMRFRRVIPRTVPHLEISRCRHSIHTDLNAPEVGIR